MNCFGWFHMMKIFLNKWRTISFLFFMKFSFFSQLLPLPDGIVIDPNEDFIVTDDGRRVKKKFFFFFFQRSNVFQISCRGNGQWAPPREQLIFHIHSPSKLKILTIFSLKFENFLLVEIINSKNKIIFVPVVEDVWRKVLWIFIDIVNTQVRLFLRIFHRGFSFLFFFR